MELNKYRRIGIDASRNRSGGAKAHIIGILSESDPEKFGISEVHVWAFKSLLDSIPNKKWIIKHYHPDLEKNLLCQLFWQFSKLKKEAKLLDIDLMFTTDASTISRFKPMIVMSQDMLSYEPGVSSYFGFGLFRLRLIIIYFLQNWAMKFSNGVIFLTNYASSIIEKSTGEIVNKEIIPHGIGDNYKNQNHLDSLSLSLKTTIQCIYVSNTAMYKHQWVVMEAIGKLRQKWPIKITFVGGGNGKSRDLLNIAIEKNDPSREYSEILEFVPPIDMPKLLGDSDISIFASSCENLPVTLLESMAVGLPIACSNRGPMVEVLENAGVYFDPENSDEIANAIETIIINDELRLNISKMAKEKAHSYSWKKCGNSTWQFINNTLKKINNE